MSWRDCCWKNTHVTDAACERGNKFILRQTISDVHNFICQLLLE